MRTTLSLEEDVDRMLRELCRQRRRPFKQLVNEALRVGLASLYRKETRRGYNYRIAPVSLGEPRLGNLDNISEILAVAEGERYR